MKSQAVSWIGVLMSFIQCFVKELQKLGGGDDDVRWLVTPEGEDLLQEFAKMVRQKRAGRLSAVKHQMGEWVLFYQKHFGIELGTVQVPEHQSGFDRLIVVAQEFCRPVKLDGDEDSKVQPMNWVFVVCQRLFKSWKYADDLDQAVTDNDRDPKNGTYAIWVRDRVEADEENRNESANHRRQQGRTDETLLERMLHELKYFDETGEHLDIVNLTLCSGSRGRGGDVPRCGFGGGGFSVVWDSSGSRGVVLRSRSVVSSTAKTHKCAAEQS